MLTAVSASVVGRGAGAGELRLLPWRLPPFAGSTARAGGGLSLSNVALGPVGATGLSDVWAARWAAPRQSNATLAAMATSFAAAWVVFLARLVAVGVDDAARSASVETKVWSGTCGGMSACSNRRKRERDGKEPTALTCRHPAVVLLPVVILEKSLPLAVRSDRSGMCWKARE